MAMSLKASFLRHSQTLATPLSWFKTTEGKTKKTGYAYTIYNSYVLERMVF